MKNSNPGPSLVLRASLAMHHSRLAAGCSIPHSPIKSSTQALPRITSTRGCTPNRGFPRWLEGSGSCTSLSTCEVGTRNVLKSIRMLHSRKHSETPFIGINTLLFDTLCYQEMLPSTSSINLFPAGLTIGHSHLCEFYISKRLRYSSMAGRYKLLESTMKSQYPSAKGISLIIQQAGVRFKHVPILNGYIIR